MSLNSAQGLTQTSDERKLFSLLLERSSSRSGYGDVSESHDVRENSFSQFYT